MSTNTITLLFKWTHKDYHTLQSELVMLATDPKQVETYLASRVDPAEYFQETWSVDDPSLQPPYVYRVHIAPDGSVRVMNSSDHAKTAWFYKVGNTCVKILVAAKTPNEAKAFALAYYPSIMELGDSAPVGGPWVALSTLSTLEEE